MVNFRPRLVEPGQEHLTNPFGPEDSGSDPNPFSDPPEFEYQNSSDLSCFLFHSSMSCNGRTLTKFVLTHHTFPNTLETILAVLREYPSLEEVGFDIGFKHVQPKPENLEPKDLIKIKLKQLESLSIKGHSLKDIKQLINIIHHISFPSSARVYVKISTSTSGRLHLHNALSSINKFADPPTHLRMDYPWQSVEFPGPNGSKFCVYDAPYSEITSLLDGELLPFSRKVKNLHLRMTSEPSQPKFTFKSSLFATLKILTIETDPHISTTLSLMLSSQSIFSLDCVVIKDVRLNEDLKNGLEQSFLQPEYSISVDQASIIIRCKTSWWKSQKDLTNSYSIQPQNPEYSVNSKHVQSEGGCWESEDLKGPSMALLGWGTNQQQSPENFINGESTQPQTQGSQSWTHESAVTRVSTLFQKCTPKLESTMALKTSSKSQKHGYTSLN